MSELHLHRLVLDARAVLALATRQQLLGRFGDVDHGYLTHAALQALFGVAAPSPFVLEHELAPRRSQEGALSLLAYAPAPLEALRTQLRPEHAPLLQWERCSSKAVPLLPAGTELAFTAKVLPTVRTRRRAPGHEASGRGQGREVDAFLAACFRAGEDTVIDRAAVYRDWFAKALAGGGPAAATLGEFSLLGFHRARLLRKEAPGGDGGRRRHLVERTSALVTGGLRIEDPAAFRTLLARGVGRHRAFGFGMLLLRRA